MRCPMTACCPRPWSCASKPRRALPTRRPVLAAVAGSWSMRLTHRADVDRPLYGDSHGQRRLPVWVEERRSPGAVDNPEAVAETEHAGTCRSRTALAGQEGEVRAPDRVSAVGRSPAAHRGASLAAHDIEPTSAALRAGPKPLAGRPLKPGFAGQVSASTLSCWLCRPRLVGRAAHTQAVPRWSAS